MNSEKAKQVINDLILTKNELNEVSIVDSFQVSIACTVLKTLYSDDELKAMFGVKLQ